MVAMELEGRCLELAIKLADERAWDVLDPATAHEWDAKQVAEAVEYLTLRGLVHPHPSRPSIFERYPQMKRQGTVLGFPVVVNPEMKSGPEFVFGSPLRFPCDCERCAELAGVDEEECGGIGAVPV